MQWIDLVLWIRLTYVENRRGKIESIDSIRDDGRVRCLEQTTMAREICRNTKVKTGF